jgi:hypothetical protein
MTLDEAIQALRMRNEPVPIPLRLPAEAEVEAAERRLRFEFPPDYRRYLLEASDVVVGTLEPAVVVPGSGNLDLVEIAESAWGEMDVPRDLLPICQDNGDYFCLNAKSEVVYWSHDGVVNEKWADLASWIQEVWLLEE